MISGCNGKTILVDLQMPKGQTFFLAGVNVKRWKKKNTRERETNGAYTLCNKDEKHLRDGGNEGRLQSQKMECGYIFHPEENNLFQKISKYENHGTSLSPMFIFLRRKMDHLRANFEGVEENVCGGN